MSAPAPERMDFGEATRSVWKEIDLPRHEPLESDAECEVCVIGAGIAGMSAAYHLAREGRRVIVVDAFDVGAGETGQTTAHLASALDDRFYQLERVHGTNGARLAYESHAAAIDDVESIVRRESIACGLMRLEGYLFLGPDDDERVLERELAAAHRIGFAGVARVPRAPISSFDTGPSLYFPRQGRFHPLRYLAGIAKAVHRYGGKIHGRTMVTEVSGGRKPRVVTSSGALVRAQSIIVATNSPFHPRIALHSKQAPYRTYAIALAIPRGSIVDALYWDTSDPYHYVRLEPGPAHFDHLIVGGEDHRSGTADDGEERYDRLDSWARQRFPMAGDLHYKWSGQVFEPFDHLAFIGPDPAGERNVYVATGDSGHGMTHGAIAGMLLADLVSGRRNPWAELYDPSRKTARAAREYVRENLDVAAALTDWVKPLGHRDTWQIAAGEGAIVRRGLHKLAVYRDPEGRLHERSAVCTHLGCIVRWNGDSKSWDCPCHGSRFSPTGTVLNGPALEALRAAPPARARTRSIAAGVGGGAVATLAMTGLLFAAQKLGWLGQLPPKKIVKGLRRRIGVLGGSSRRDGVVAAIAHLGFGMGAGALFGMLHSKRSGVLRAALTGAGFGTAVWATSYYGWVPALGLMREPHDDRPFRPTAMVAGHIVYGSVLGAIVDGAAPSP